MSNKSRREALRKQREAEEAARKRRKRTMLGAGILALVLVVVGGGALIYVNRDSIGGGLGNQSVPPNANAELSGIALEPDKAKAGAPLLVVYQDFQCPFCKLFHEAFETKIQKAVDAGALRVEYRTMTFLDTNLRNDASTRSGVAAACADVVGQYGPYYNEIYANQPQREGDGYSDQLLRSTIPNAIGLTGEPLSKFQSCYDNKATKSFVDGTNEKASRAGITSTPTYVLDGEDITKKLNYQNPSSIDQFLPKVGN